MLGCCQRPLCLLSNTSQQHRDQGDGLGNHSLLALSSAFAALIAWLRQTFTFWGVWPWAVGPGHVASFPASDLVEITVGAWCLLVIDGRNCIEQQKYGVSEKYCQRRQGAACRTCIPAPPTHPPGWALFPVLVGFTILVLALILSGRCLSRT